MRDLGGLAAARDLEWDDGAGGAEVPDLAPEVGEAGRPRAGDFEQRVADLDAGALRRAAGCEAGTTRRSPASVVYMPSHGRGGG